MRVSILLLALVAGIVAKTRKGDGNEPSVFDEETSVPLYNAAVEGLRMPIMGLGTGTYMKGDKWDNGVAEKAVLAFLKAGGRRIDTSLMYETQKGIGRAIKKSGIPRNEIFITTKTDSKKYGAVPAGYKEMIKSMETCLSELQTDYVDLALIHFPGSPMIDDAPNPKYPGCHRRPDDWSKCRIESWKGMEEIFNRGMARAIGVSNYAESHLQELIDRGGLLPAVNQIEYHPFWRPDDIVTMCEEHNITANGYSPLGAPDHMQHFRKEMPILLPDHEVVKRIAKETGYTPAQVLIRYSIDKGLVVNPRTKDKKHMKENLAVLDLDELTEEQLDALDELYIDCPYNTNGNLRAYT